MALNPSNSGNLEQLALKGFNNIIGLNDSRDDMLPPLRTVTLCSNSAFARVAQYVSSTVFLLTIVAAKSDSFITSLLWPTDTDAYCVMLPRDIIKTD